MASERSRKAENDILCALDLKKWDFEEEDGAYAEEDDEDEGDVTAETPTPASKKRQISSVTSSRTSRSGRSAGIIKSKDISAYLTSKGGKRAEASFA